MRLIRYLVLAAGLCFACYPTSMAGEGKNKKKKVVVDDYYANLPQPDEIMPSLTPQPHMAPEVVPGEQVLQQQQQEQQEHTANFRNGGIDVSHYQGTINWREVARTQNIHYVYIKATQGAKLRDETYHTNLRGARKAGLRVGAYHFYSPSVDVHAQFNNLKAVVKLKDQDLIPIIDIEHRGKASLRQFQSSLRLFLRLVEQHYGVRPILYTSRDFYNKYLAGPFTHYKYMIARYNGNIPKLCDNATFVMWQYSSTSRISGIRGHVDRSCFVDNYTLSDILLR